MSEALSVDAASRRMKSSDATPAVFMVGPALSVKGGVSAVERLALRRMPAGVAVRHIATMEEGSKLRKLLVFVQALAKMAMSLRRGDLAHVHFASGASSRRKMLIARLAARRGAHVVLHAHGGGYRKFWERASARERAFTLSTLQRADRLVVLGEAWREFFASIGVPRERIIVLPNPVVLPPCAPPRAVRPQVHLVYLGLIARHKGTFDLVEAIARLPPAVLARLRVVIAGNGALDELRALASERGVSAQVEVRAWVDAQERDRLLAAADMFVLPSYAEGLPMALLEAMAWGAPPICTPVGSIPEYVRDGENGLLVRAGAVNELACAIEKLTADPALRAQLGKRARAAVEPLDADHYMRELCGIYQSLASAPVCRKRAP